MILDDNAIDNLVLLAVTIAFMLLFWLFEAVWKNDRRWIAPVVVFPPVILIFIYKYWEETRARCFFIFLYVIMLTLLGVATGYDFDYRLWQIIEKISLWPYFLCVEFLSD